MDEEAGMLLTTVLCLGVLGQEVLPGSYLSLQQAKEDARIIVVAEVVEGRGVIISGRFRVMLAIKLKPSRVLKGKVDGKELDTLGLFASGKERLPNYGEE